MVSCYCLEWLSGREGKHCQAHVVHLYFHTSSDTLLQQLHG
jgi:hypothetical protein